MLQYATFYNSIWAFVCPWVLVFFCEEVAKVKNVRVSDRVKNQGCDRNSTVLKAEWYREVLIGWGSRDWEINPSPSFNVSVVGVRPAD